MTKLSVLIVLPAVAVLALLQTARESQDQAIRRTALDYCDGWYTGDAERMERALHPDLAKRVLMVDPHTGREHIKQMSASELIQAVRAGGGKDTPPDQQRREITILDVYGDAASVKLQMHDWIDYLHMSRIDGQWKIVNVLWELTPEAKKRRRSP